MYYHLTGKLPAVRGYDFMGVSSCKKTDDQVDRAIKWATQCGGIVTMCWHWYAPNDMNDYSKGSSFYYKTTGYDHKTCFDLCKGVTEGTAEYEFIIREIYLCCGGLCMRQTATGSGGETTTNSTVKRIRSCGI